MSLSIPAFTPFAAKKLAERNCKNLLDIEGNLWNKYCRESSKSGQFSRYYNSRVRKYGVKWLDSTKNFAMVDAALHFASQSSLKLESAIRIEKIGLRIK